MIMLFNKVIGCWCWTQLQRCCRIF